MTRYVRPKPRPLPVTDRATAPYYVVINSFTRHDGSKAATVYVKEGNFFRSQGGLTGEWGSSWIPIRARSLDDARLRAHASEGTECPTWHFQDEFAEQ